MGNALTACCAAERPVEKIGDLQIGGSKSGASKDRLDRNEDQGPDEWTDTSMDMSRTDNSDAGGPSFRNMTKQDYLTLYDGIHSLLTEKKIGREQENELYELIGKQDRRLAAAYQQFKATGDPFSLTAPLKTMRNYRP